MPGETTETETTTETTETTTPPPAVAKPAKAAKAVAEATSGEPEFLKDRLDRERRSILKDLGIKLKRGEDPNERLEEYRTELEADKTSNKDLKTKVATHEATIERLSAAEAAVKVFAQVEFDALSPALQAIVKAAAGDNPNERLKTMAIMKATSGPPAATTTQVAAGAVTSQAAKPAIPAPAQTAPAAGSPPPASSQAVDVRAEHARLQASNPLLAAAYLLQHRAEYYKQPV